MNETHFIALNGPPGCGKDTLADALMKDKQLKDAFRLLRYKFADPLKKLTHDFMKQFGGPAYHEEAKNRPMEFVNSKHTFRQAYISFSEDFAKPMFGQDVFGRIMAYRITVDPQFGSTPTLVIVSDSGFEPEYRAVERNLDPENCAVIQIHREGHTFEGDSRSYWAVPHVDSITRVMNSSDRAIFEQRGVEAVKKMMRARQWMR